MMQRPVSTSWIQQRKLKVLEMTSSAMRKPFSLANQNQTVNDPLHFFSELLILYCCFLSDPFAPTNTELPPLVEILRERAYDIFHLGPLRIRSSPTVTILIRSENNRKFLNKKEIVQMLSGLCPPSKPYSILFL